MKAKEEEYDIKVEVEMCDIRFSQLKDLLLKKGERQCALAIAKDVYKLVTVSGATIESPKDFMKKGPHALIEILNIGFDNRTTRETAANETSSRSHLILQIKIKMTHKKTCKITVGKLTFADLAGSERVARIGVV